MRNQPGLSQARASGQLTNARTALLLGALLFGGVTAPGALAATPAGTDASPTADLEHDENIQSAIRLAEVWLDAELAYEQIPGMSVGVLYSDRVIWERGLGFADVQAQRPATPETLYSICSISKLFTSIAALQLRDQGRLSLDSEVAELLPWFDLQVDHDDGERLTLRRLLTHSSGLPRETAHPYWTGPDFPFPERSAIREKLSTQHSLYPSGRYFQYSNLGLTLVGEVVAEVSGEPFDEYVRRNILEPLGLDNTHPELPENERGKGLATGYGGLGRDRERAEMPFFQARGIAPAAGFASNVRDLLRFGAWQLRLLNLGATTAEDRAVLAPATLREMHRVQWMDPDWETTWGLGFATWRRDGETWVGHGGSCPGFRSQLAIVPAKKMVVVAAVNAMGVSPRHITDQLYSIFEPAVSKAMGTPPTEGKAPERTAEAPEPGETSPDLGRYTGLYRSVWGEAAVLEQNGELVMLDLPSRNPQEAMSRIEATDEEHVFRRVRDDKTHGEEIRFEVDAAGVTQRLWQHGTASEKVE